MIWMGLTESWEPFEVEHFLQLVAEEKETQSMRSQCTTADLKMEEATQQGAESDPLAGSQQGNKSLSSTTSRN